MRRNRNGQRLGVVLTLLMTSVANAAEPQFRWSRTVELIERTQEEFVVVTLDSDIHEQTLPNWSDLRIVDSQGQPQATTIRTQAKEEPHRFVSTWKATDVTLRPHEDRLEVTVRLQKDDPQPDAILLYTPLKDFEQRVDIYAGTDPEPLVTGALIFDYSQYMDVRSARIRLPENTAREFRLVIGSLTAEQESPLRELTQRRQDGQPTENVEKTTFARRPFRIDQIVCQRTNEQILRNDSVRATVPVRIVSQTSDPKTKESILELSTQREPLVGLRIRTTSRNFSRQATVEQEVESSGTASWEPIGQRPLIHLAFQHLAQEELEIGLREETRAAKLRLRIKDGDSPPLTITTVEGESVVRLLYFFAVPRESYRLVYGAEDAEALQLDQNALRAAIGASITPVAAKLGPSTPATDQPVTKRINWKVLLNSPTVLGSIIGLLVVVLAVLLFRTAKRIDQTVPPTGVER